MNCHDFQQVLRGVKSVKIMTITLEPSHDIIVIYW